MEVHIFTANVPIYRTSALRVHYTVRIIFIKWTFTAVDPLNFSPSILNDPTEVIQMFG